MSEHGYADGVRLLFADEVAELIGVAAENVKFYLYEGNRARRDGTATAATFPAPYDKSARQVWNGHHNVTIASNRWKASDIAAWILARPASAAWPDQRRAEVAGRLSAMVA